MLVAVRAKYDLLLKYICEKINMEICLESLKKSTHETNTFIVSLKNITGFMSGWCEDFRDVTVALTRTGNIQAEAGRGSEQCEPVQDVPAHGRAWTR